jgi:hypothetical protein
VGDRAKRLLLAALGLALGAPALGDTPANRPSPPAGGFLPALGDATPFRLQLEGEGMLGADYGGAEVSWARSMARLRLRGPVSDRVELAFRLSHDYAVFEFDGDTSSLPLGGAGGEDPFDDLIDTGARFGASIRFRESWAVLAEGYVQSKLERGAEIDSAWKGGGILGVGHRFSDDLDVALALKIGTRFDRAPVVWPNLRVRWHIAEGWDFDLNNLQLSVTHSLAEHWSLMGFAAVRSQRYRLADRDGGPDGPGEGSIGNRFVPIGLEAEWHPRPHLRFMGTVGAVVWQRLKVNDDHGNEFSSESTSDLAPLLSLQVEGRF